MLCPFCLREVQQFQEVARQDGRRGYNCPQCKEEVPLRYVRDYHRYPPLVFSLVGLPGHGKTVYLTTLLYELDRITTRCPEFSYAALDEEGMRVVREKQRVLEEGHLPESTRRVFPRPVILRLENVPPLGRCHLLVYDTAGEVFQQVSHLVQNASYVLRSRVVVWLVSLRDLQHPTDLQDFLTRYVQSVLEMGGNPKEQTLFIVLTKGDELVAGEEVPHTIKEYLAKEPSEPILETTGDARRNAPTAGLSQAIEAWLGRQRGYTNFVRRARQEFKWVEYGVVSALGSAPRGQEQLVTVVPRGVAGVLLRLAQLERETRGPQWRTDWIVRMSLRLIRLTWERLRAELRRWEEVRRRLEERGAQEKALRSLSPANPWHWLVLLWWLLVMPQVLRAREELYGAEKARLEAVGYRLSSTLIWGPLLMAWGWVAIHRQELEELPIITWLLNLLITWLLNLWGWLLIPIAVGWVLTGRFGTKRDQLQSPVRALVARVLAASVATSVAFGVAGGVAASVAFGVAGGVAPSVTFSVAFGVALAVGVGVAFGVAFSVAFGVALAVGVGVAFGVAFGVVFVVAGVVAGVVAQGIKESIDAGRPSWIGRTAFAALAASWAVMLWQVGSALVRM